MEVDVKSMVVTDENDKHERALDEQSNGAAKKRKLGGIRTMPFILGNRSPRFGGEKRKTI